jgi:hypothetical protein
MDAPVAEFHLDIENPSALVKDLSKYHILRPDILESIWEDDVTFMPAEACSTCSKI